MSTERTAETPSGIPVALKTEDKDATNARAARKAKLARVLDMGYLNDRLAVPLPTDVHGEWVRDDPLEIQRKMELGFQIDTKYAAPKALHSDGTGKPKIGDVVFMVTSKENFDLLEEIRREKFAEMHIRKHVENAEFGAKVKSAGKDMSLHDDSVVRPFTPSIAE